MYGTGIFDSTAQYYSVCFFFFPNRQYYERHNYENKHSSARHCSNYHSFEMSLLIFQTIPNYLFIRCDVVSPQTNH